VVDQEQYYSSLLKLNVMVFLITHLIMALCVVSILFIGFESLTIRGLNILQVSLTFIIFRWRAYYKLSCSKLKSKLRSRKKPSPIQNTNAQTSARLNAWHFKRQGKLRRGLKATGHPGLIRVIKKWIFKKTDSGFTDYDSSYFL